MGRNVEGQLDLFSQMSDTSTGAGEDFHIEDHGEFSLPELLKMERRSAVCTFPVTRWMATVSRCRRSGLAALLT